MNAPLDIVCTIETARSESRSELRAERVVTILEQLEAMGRRLSVHLAPIVERGDTHLASDQSGVAVVAEQPASAWEEAVHLGNVRARRKAQGLDISVRAIASEVGYSRGHAGECLQINDAFNNTLLWFIGDNGSLDDGRARLARLSVRTLRTLARLPTDLERFREARRITACPKSELEMTAGERHLRRPTGLPAPLHR